MIRNQLLWGIKPVIFLLGRPPLLSSPCTLNRPPKSISLLIKNLLLRKGSIGKQQLYVNGYRKECYLGILFFRILCSPQLCRYLVLQVDDLFYLHHPARRQKDYNKQADVD